MNDSAALPSPFDSLAGICQFIDVTNESPDFYRKHQNAIDYASGFVVFLSNSQPTLKDVIFAARKFPVADCGPIFEQSMKRLSLDDASLNWIDQQMTFVLEALLPVALDPELPEWLVESKWAITGAFNMQAST